MNQKIKFISGVMPPSDRTDPALWFIFQENKLLVREESESVSLPLLMDLQELGLTGLRQNYLGQLEGRHCYVVEVAEGSLQEKGLVFQGLRQVYGRLDEGLFWIAARAIQIMDWDRTHQFCSRCSTPLKTSQTERAKECPNCGLLQFPRLAPAIIVLVERGEEVLLARSRHFMPGMYSVLAGFVEPGESLEEAVVREVREETGISIKDIQYFGSQPWPFPHSLMLGFTATYAGGEIVLDDQEIEDAGWFRADHLPRIPGKISIARKLIDGYLSKHGKLRED